MGRIVASDESAKSDQATLRVLDLRMNGALKDLVLKSNMPNAVL